MKITITTRKYCTAEAAKTLCPFLNPGLSLCDKYEVPLLFNRRADECLKDHPGPIEIEWPEPAKPEAA